jgi:hypothetical protein
MPTLYRCPHCGHHCKILFDNLAALVHYRHMFNATGDNAMTRRQSTILYFLTIAPLFFFMGKLLYLTALVIQ